LHPAKEGEPPLDSPKIDARLSVYAQFSASLGHGEVRQAKRARTCPRVG